MPIEVAVDRIDDDQFERTFNVLDLRPIVIHFVEDLFQRVRFLRSAR